VNPFYKRHSVVSAFELQAAQALATRFGVPLSNVLFHVPLSLVIQPYSVCDRERDHCFHATVPLLLVDKPHEANVLVVALFSRHPDEITARLLLQF
jgi:hypothetical protein